MDPSQNMNGGEPGNGNDYHVNGQSPNHVAPPHAQGDPNVHPHPQHHPAGHQEPQVQHVHAQAGNNAPMQEQAGYQMPGQVLAAPAPAANGYGAPMINGSHQEILNAQSPEALAGNYAPMQPQLVNQAPGVLGAPAGNGYDAPMNNGSHQTVCQEIQGQNLLPQAGSNVPMQPQLVYQAPGQVLGAPAGNGYDAPMNNGSHLSIPQENQGQNLQPQAGNYAPMQPQLVYQAPGQILAAPALAANGNGTPLNNGSHQAIPQEMQDQNLQPQPGNNVSMQPQLVNQVLGPPAGNGHGEAHQVLPQEPGHSVQHHGGVMAPPHVLNGQHAVPLHGANGIENGPSANMAVMPHPNQEQLQQHYGSFAPLQHQDPNNPGRHFVAPPPIMQQYPAPNQSFDQGQYDQYEPLQHNVTYVSPDPAPFNQALEEKRDLRDIVKAFQISFRHPNVAGQGKIIPRGVKRPSEILDPRFAKNAKLDLSPFAGMGKVFNRTESLNFCKRLSWLFKNIETCSLTAIDLSTPKNNSKDKHFMPSMDVGNLRTIASRCPNLEVLDISGNKGLVTMTADKKGEIKTETISAISDLTRSCPNLTKLFVYDCNFPAFGLASFVNDGCFDGLEILGYGQVGAMLSFARRARPATDKRKLKLTHADNSMTKISAFGVRAISFLAPDVKTLKTKAGDGVELSDLTYLSSLINLEVQWKKDVGVDMSVLRETRFSSKLTVGALLQSLAVTCDLLTFENLSVIASNCSELKSLWLTCKKFANEPVPIETLSNHEHLKKLETLYFKTGESKELVTNSLGPEVVSFLLKNSSGGLKNLTLASNSRALMNKEALMGEKGILWKLNRRGLQKLILTGPVRNDVNATFESFDLVLLQALVLYFRGLSHLGNVMMWNVTKEEMDGFKERWCSVINENIKMWYKKLTLK